MHSTSNLSHHDSNRKGVGKTAHLVAFLRLVESKKTANERLIFDPYAEVLCGNFGEKDFIELFEEKVISLKMITILFS